VGSHTVNGVAELHSKIIKEDLFRDFDTVFPGRLANVTNGITPRRWLAQANPKLARLINDTIGPEWITAWTACGNWNLWQRMPHFAGAGSKPNGTTKNGWHAISFEKSEPGVDPDTLFSVQVKRIHEYKRQLLNVLHVITCTTASRPTPGHPWCRARSSLPARPPRPTTRPNDHQADQCRGRENQQRPGRPGKLRVLFLPNYCVSQAEKIIPAADLSEQISTAGMEASGTGNMKMSLNGALTIGTLDGANVEIMEEVGEENIFIFGLTADQVTDLRNGGLQPAGLLRRDAELRQTLDSISRGDFSPEEPHLFAPIVESLLHQGDYYMLLADYRAYVTAQEAVGKLFLDKEEWARKSILNTARMGKFSSDRSVMEYAEYDLGLEAAAGGGRINKSE
jgi:starch phosphorylase